MSGIVGLLLRDGQPADPAELDQMVAALKHRGPDGAGAWLDGPTGLGHCLLKTTPESMHEKQPCMRGGLTITADARLDNRAELIRLLDLDPHPPIEYTDDQLILSAYACWGGDCPKYLLGDFSFAVWDRNQGTLFCARDPLGVKPFYYHLEELWFIFASEIKGILANPRAPRCLNEAWLAEFFLPVTAMQDRRSTFYAGVLRLPPAHTLTVSMQRCTISPYWALDPEREIRLSSDQEYAEAFFEQFSQAVSCRLRSAYPVGSTLSGGLDSSSISCAARDMLVKAGAPPLHTFSAIFGDAPDADESPYIQSVVDQGNLAPHFIHPDQASPFIDLDLALQHLDEPFYGMNYFMPWSIARCARDSGVRVLLDGTDGDTTVSHGFDYLDQLARTRQWDEFAREASLVTQHFDHPRYATKFGILYSFGLPHVTGRARQGKWLQVAQDTRKLNALFGVSTKRLVMASVVKPLAPRSMLNLSLLLRGRRPPAPPPLAYISDDFARRMDFANRMSGQTPPAEAPKSNGRGQHFHYLSLGLLPYSLELMNRFSAAFQIETRFPFCDRRLVEFCLALPASQKLQGGWSRYVMRQAMAGTLPEKVRWRGGKISLAQVFPYSLREYGREYVEEVISKPSAAVYNYLNLQVVGDYYRQFLASGQVDNLQWVWFAVIFSRWLENAQISI